MPLYDYQCKHCEHIVEDIFQHMSDDPLKKCPECDEDGLERIITGGIAGFVSGSNTIGSLADKNAKMNKNKIAEANHKKKESEPQPLQPWYKDSKYGVASSKEINKMSTEQKTRYIMEGKK